MLDQPMHGSNQPRGVDWCRVPTLSCFSLTLGVDLLPRLFDQLEPLVSSVRIGTDPRIDIEQSAQCASRVGNNTNVDGKNFADFPWIFLYVNRARFGLDPRLRKIAVLANQPAANCEQQIGFAPNRQVE